MVYTNYTPCRSLPSDLGILLAATEQSLEESSDVMSINFVLIHERHFISTYFWVNYKHAVTGRHNDGIRITSSVIIVIFHSATTRLWITLCQLYRAINSLFSSLGCCWPYH
jgi:hypothetical protein